MNYEDNKKIAEDEANRWAVTRWIRSSLNINPKFKTYEESKKEALEKIEREEDEQRQVQEPGVATNAGNNDKKSSQNNG